MFTYQYHQPAEYHFSLDSIHLAEFVAEKLKYHSDLHSLRILDLCAGCGVIGMELSWYLRDIKQLDFVEVQEIYTEFFEKNVATVNRSELQCHWHLLNYDELLSPEWENKFDIIVSNPPYFQSGHGMLSPSDFKNRCRFYLDSTFEKYIHAMANTLKVNGTAYFLLRSLKQHGHDMLATSRSLLPATSFNIEIISQIRGTDIALMQKLS